MNHSPRPARVDTKQSWPEFAAAVAAMAHVQAETIPPSTRLEEDLGLDSLALTELVVLLIVDFEMDTLADDLDRDWSRATVGELYHEYCTGDRISSA